MAIRDTAYATEVARGTCMFSGTSEEARLERIHIKKLGQEEIRSSWWKDGNMVMRPLDLTEGDLLALFQDAIARGVLSSDFVRALRDLPDPPQSV